METVLIPKKLLEQIEHEFTSLHGLYASDNKEFNEPFQLDYKNLLSEIEFEKG